MTMFFRYTLRNRLRQLIDWFIDWLIDSLVGWLIDWLEHPLNPLHVQNSPLIFLMFSLDGIFWTYFHAAQFGLVTPYFLQVNSRNMPQKSNLRGGLLGGRSIWNFMMHMYIICTPCVHSMYVYIYINIWFVVWNMNFIFPYIRNVIIPTDFHVFFSEG